MDINKGVTQSNFLQLQFARKNVFICVLLSRIFPHKSVVSFKLKRYRQEYYIQYMFRTLPVCHVHTHNINLSLDIGNKSC